MAKKGNRILYKVHNPKTGTFFVTEGNKQNNMPEELKKFDPKTKKHETFKVKRFK
jgi:ribosomal protein L33